LKLSRLAISGALRTRHGGMGRLIDILRRVSYTNCCRTRVLGRQVVAGGGKL
jgi:hypothetical protein